MARFSLELTLRTLKLQSTTTNPFWWIFFPFVQGLDRFAMISQDGLSNGIDFCLKANGGRFADFGFVRFCAERKDSASCPRVKPNEEAFILQICTN